MLTYIPWEFFSLDCIPKYRKEKGEKYEFSRYQESRGMYKQKRSKILINADLNGSYDIIRKVIPTVFAVGNYGIVVPPLEELGTPSS